MKTKNKILLGVAAASGVVASFGATFALYQNTTNADSLNIGIGAVKTYDSTEYGVNYKIGKIETYSDENCSKSITNYKLSPDLKNVYLKAPLTFAYDTNSKANANENAADQDYMVGTLKVGITVNNDIASLKSAKATAKIQGYPKAVDGSTTYETYFTAKKSSDFFNTTFGSTDAVYHYIDVAVDTASTIYCVIGLDLSTAIDADFLKVASITNAFDVTLNWGAFDTGTDTEGVATGRPTAEDNTDAPDANLNPNLWITGDMNAWTTKMVNDFQMAPNIKGKYYEETYENGASGTHTVGSGVAKVEWVYKGLKTFSKLKVYDEGDSNNHWIDVRGYSESKGISKDANNNAVLYVADTNSYDIYYTRFAESSSQKGFYVVGGATNVAAPAAS